MMKKVKVALIGVTLGALSSHAASTTLQQGFTYQGRFFAPDGITPMTDVVDLVLGVYSQNGNCLLYEETQTGINLVTNSGLFSVKVGSAVGSDKRTSHDPHLSLSRIFSNTGTVRADDSGTTNTCPGGYAPGAGENRRLRVSVYPTGSSSGETMSPDLAINPAPQSTVAETLQGFDSDSFVKTSTNITQDNIEALVGGGDASTLHNHDGRYLRAGSGSSQDLGSAGSYVSGSGTFGIGTSSPSMDLGLGGAQARSIGTERNTTANTVGSAMTIKAGGATSGATNKAGGNLVLSSGLSTGTGSSNIVFQTSSSGSSGVADNTIATRMVIGKDSVVLSPLTSLGLGQFSDSDETDLVNALTAAASVSDRGKAWFNTSSNQMKYWNGSSAVAASGGSYSLPVAANGTLGGIKATTGKITLDGTGAITAIAADTAGSATNFSGSLAGDISGTQGSTSVDKIKGRTVASTAPTNNQILTSMLVPPSGSQRHLQHRRALVVHSQVM